MVAWRAAGINYVRFSQIAAEVTRNCTKAAEVVGRAPTGPKKVAAGATLKMTAWENGKAVKKV